jgi:ribosome biogenesis protein ERB1
MSATRKTRTKTPVKALKRETKAEMKPPAAKPKVEKVVKVEPVVEVIDNSDRPAPQKRKSVRRQEAKVEASVARKTEKKMLEDKYDVNLGNSDDSSDEEVLLRTGNVPEHWYDLYDHSGYSVNGKQVIKPVEKDELEKFIERQADKNWWRKITDRLNNKEVKLSMADLQLI